MKQTAKVVAVFCAVLVLIAGVGYRSNLIILRIDREDFLGGRLSVWDSLLQLPPGSGRTWTVIRAEHGEAEFSLECNDGRRVHAGYLEGGALQYVSVAITDCRFDDGGTSTIILFLPLNVAERLFSYL